MPHAPLARRASAAALSLWLALASAGLASLPALAEDSSVTFREHWFSDTPPSQADYFDVVAAAGIVKGDAGLGGPCRPSSPITRAEFAVMVLRLLSLDPEFKAPEIAGLPFRDAAMVPAWATSAVGACWRLGIVNGEPDGLGGANFKPLGSVSGAEAVAMLLRALRNGDNVTGGWPAGYLFRAYETGLFSSDVAAEEWRFIEALTPLTRAQMAYLLHNALSCSRGYLPGGPGGESTFTLDSIGGRLAGYSLILDANLLLRRVSTSDGHTLDLAGTVVATGVRSSADLIGRRVFWVENTRGQIAFFRRYAREATVGGQLDKLVLDQKQTRVESVRLTDGRDLDLAPGAIVELNGRRWPFDPATILPEAEVTAIMDQGFAAYVSVVQEDLPEAVIMSIGFDQPPAGSPGAPTGRITARISMGLGDIPLVVNSDTMVYLNGQPADLSDLREWDIFYAATSGSTPKTALRLYAYRDRVTGTVSDVSRLYDTTGFHWQARVAESGTGETKALGFSPFCQDQVNLGLIGSELTFCLNRHGKITFFRSPAPEPGVARVVKILRSTSVGGHDLLTVDWRGTELTYSRPAEVQAPAAGTLVGLVADAGGTVTRAEVVRPALFQATVVAYDDESGRLTLTCELRNWGLDVSRVAIYAAANAGTEQAFPGACVPVESLAAGQSAWLDDPGAPTYILVLPVTGS